MGNGKGMSTGISGTLGFLVKNESGWLEARVLESPV